ncbi:MAG: TonB-dependent receptor [Chlorobi bacterium]|nr:TonB-dependent receptor [Chlorobiota bacterium]
MGRLFFNTIIIMLLSGNLLISQNEISGKIIDKETKSEITGAVVYFPQLHKGSSSDKNGNFKIQNLQSGNFEMIVSLFGYETQISKIRTDTVKHTLLIKLVPQIFETQEVVVSADRFSLQHENAVEIKSVEIANSDNLSSNLIDKLAFEPGVDVISKSPGVEKPVIRGLSNTNILFVDNGIRLENFQFSEDHPYMADEFGVDRVEVIKGPASLLYGSDAVGGVIYTVREKPALQNTISGDYNLLYFSNNEGLISNLGIKGAGKKIHAGIRGGFNSQKDYFDGNGAEVPNSRFNQYSVKSNLGVSYKFGKTDVYYDIQKMKLGMTVPPAIALVNDNLRKNKFWFQDLSSTVAAVKNKFFAGKTMIDADFSYQSNNRKLQTSELLPQFKMVDMTLNTLGYNVKSTYSFTNKYELITGIQGMYQTNKNAEAPAHIIPDAFVFDFSGYTLLTADFTDNLHFQSGIRYDFRHILTKPEDIKPVVNKFYSNFSFSGGINYQISEQILVRANLASAHRTPNIAELTQNGPHGIYYEIGNSELKTQKNYEPDISFHYHSGTFIFEMSAFYNLLKNYIYLQKTNTYSENGMLIYSYAQTDAAIKGTEGGIEYMPVHFMKLYANYSSLIAKKIDGSNLPFIPQNKIRSEVKFTVKKFAEFSEPYFSVNSTYAFKQTNFAQFETETPAYYILNSALGFTYKIKDKSLSFKLSVKNLLNEKYIDHLSTLKDTDYLMPGRNVIFSIKYSF